MRNKAGCPILSRPLRKGGLPGAPLLAAFARSGFRR